MLHGYCQSREQFHPHYVEVRAVTYPVERIVSLCIQSLALERHGSPCITVMLLTIRAPIPLGWITPLHLAAKCHSHFPNNPRNSFTIAALRSGICRSNRGGNTDGPNAAVLRSPSFIDFAAHTFSQVHRMLW